MNNTTEDYAQKRQISFQLSKAKEIYKKKFKDTAIVERINLTDPTTKGHITTEVYSKCLNFHKGRNYTVHISLLTLVAEFVMKIVKDEFKATWNSQTNVFDFETSDKNPDSNKTKANIPKWIAGKWIGYAWNKLQSDRYMKDIVNIFGLQINFDQEKPQILCRTQKLKFEKGTIKEILEGRLMIELVDEKRKIIMMTRIDKVDDEYLAKMSSLEFGYIDSGPETVRVGLVLLERIPLQEFDKIEPGSKLVSVLDADKQEMIRKLLVNTQLLTSNI